MCMQHESKHLYQLVTQLQRHFPVKHMCTGHHGVIDVTTWCNKKMGFQDGETSSSLDSLDVNRVAGGDQAIAQLNLDQESPEKLIRKLQWQLHI